MTNPSREPDDDHIFGPVFQLPEGAEERCSDRMNHAPLYRLVSAIVGLGIAVALLGAMNAAAIILPVNRASDSYHQHFFTDTPASKIVPGDGKLHVLSLGDSQTAGSSAGDIYLDPATNAYAKYDSTCLVSAHSLGAVVAERLGGESENISCIGLTTQDLLKQAARIPYDSDIIIVSVGANDFVDRIADFDCIITPGHCTDQLDIAVQSQRSTVAQAVTSTLAQIKMKVKPSAKVYYYGFLDPLPAKGGLYCAPWSDAVLARINKDLDVVTATLRAAADNAGVEYIDPNTVLSAEQQPCASRSAFNDFTLVSVFVQGLGVYGDALFHLHRPANERLGSLLAARIVNSAPALLLRESPAQAKDVIERPAQIGPRSSSGK